MKAVVGVSGVALIVAFAFGGIVVLLMVSGGHEGPAAASPMRACTQGQALSVSEEQVPPELLEEFSPEQLNNAAAIMSAGADLGASRGAQTIAVMTALGESTLVNIDYGDWETSGVRNPDGSPTSSLGLFQQQEWWGTQQQRMDPYTAATLFYQGGRDGSPGLLDTPGWESMAPTLAANSVQGNLDPDHYSEYWPAAARIVAGLADIDVEQVDCTIGGAGVSSGQWTTPLPGSSVTSTFGQRVNPVTGVLSLHAGVDLPAAAGTSILAAADGVVTHTSCEAWQGRSPCQVLVDHGEVDGHSVWTLYVHMYQSGVLVSPGDHVNAGQAIALVGSNGQSTGPHLHFEVWIDGSATEPTAFMSTMGVDL
ncbi:M23 family metallopeptidase [Ruania zhangjianzhongii]|uniref:M23 family metallopeptidase n=1 Tax=Ruania zhangjianzhongii TaxID=2603206 RepID=UPI0011CAE7D2|nr:M23 family metallopeptidase [Ruania zhangjianzhongii]